MQQRNQLLGNGAHDGLKFRHHADAAWGYRARQKIVEAGHAYHLCFKALKINVSVENGDTPPANDAERGKANHFLIGIQMSRSAIT